MATMKPLFESMFWDAIANPNSANTYPFYNVLKQEKDYIIEIAVAGFGIDDLTVEYDGASLEVAGNKADEYSKDVEFVHRGLSSRSFKQRFAIRGQFDIGDVALMNGILSIRMVSKTEVVKPKIQIKDGIRSYTQPVLEKFDTGD